MLERERHRLILKLVNERAVVGVVELVDLMDASEATIRRDINALAERGELRRVRGGAEALNPRHEAHLAGVPFSLNQSVAIAEKRAIARAAAAMVAPGDSLIVTGGTTTWRLVEFLRHAECDILTNSFPIAAELLAATTLFAGAYAVGRLGFMETDPLVAQATRRLLRRAERLVVMVDSRKLTRRSSMVVAPLAQVDVLITDEGADDEALAPLRDAGVQVITAAVLPEDRAVESAA